MESEQQPDHFHFDGAVIDRRGQDVHQFHALVVGQLLKCCTEILHVVFGLAFRRPAAKGCSGLRLAKGSTCSRDMTLPNSTCDTVVFSRVQEISSRNGPSLAAVGSARYEASQIQTSRSVEEQR
jgi:hypothetical protein